MGRNNRTVVVGLILTIAIVRPVAAQVTGEQVKQAITGGVEYLKKHQNKGDGSWGENSIAGRWNVGPGDARPAQLWRRSKIAAHGKSSSTYMGNRLAPPRPFTPLRCKRWCSPLRTPKSTTFKSRAMPGGSKRHKL